MTKQGRIKYLDWLKGLGLYGIISQHVIPGMQDPFNLWLTTFKIVCFFWVSGILNQLNGHSETMTVTLKKNCKSIMLPYFTFSIVGVLSNTVQMLVSDNFSLRTIAIDLLSTLSLRGVGTLWFLPVYFFGLMLFTFCRNKGQKILIGTLIPFFAIAVIFGVVFSYLNDGNLLLKGLSLFVLVIGKSFLAAVYFSMGYLYSKKMGHKKKSSILVLILLIVSIGIAQFCKNIDLNFLNFGDSIALFIISSFAALVSLTSAFNIIEMKYPKVKLKFLSYMSQNSLIIMFTHYFFGIIPIAHFLSKQVKGNLYYFVSITIVLGIEVIIITILKALKNRRKRTIG